MAADAQAKAAKETDTAATKLAQAASTSGARPIGLPALGGVPGGGAFGAFTTPEAKAAAGHGMGALVAERVLSAEREAAAWVAHEDTEQDFASGGRSDLTANALPFTE